MHALVNRSISLGQGNLSFLHICHCYTVNSVHSIRQDIACTYIPVVFSAASAHVDITSQKWDIGTCVHSYCA